MCLRTKKVHTRRQGKFMGRKSVSCPPKLQAALDGANLLPREYKTAELNEVLKLMRTEGDRNEWLAREGNSKWNALLSAAPSGETKYFCTELRKWHEIKAALCALIEAVSDYNPEKGVSDITKLVGSSQGRRSTRLIRMVGHDAFEVGRIFSITVPVRSEWEIKSNGVIKPFGPPSNNVLDWLAATRINVERLALCPVCNAIFWREQLGLKRRSLTCSRSCSNRRYKSTTKE